jgi:hypothetical protein
MNNSRKQYCYNVINETIKKKQTEDKSILIGSDSD